MKQPVDQKTLELPGLDVPKRRGRPASGNAKTAAERMAAKRERDRALARVAHRHERRRSDPDLIAAIAVRLEAGDDEGALWAWLELGQRKGWKTP